MEVPLGLLSFEQLRMTSVMLCLPDHAVPPQNCRPARAAYAYC